MKFKMNTKELSMLLYFLILIGNGTAIRCYKCTSDGDKDKSEPRCSQGLGRIIDCPDGSCYKWKVKTASK